jgi:hypothetical protein
VADTFSGRDDGRPVVVIDVPEYEVHRRRGWRRVAHAAGRAVRGGAVPIIDEFVRLADGCAARGLAVVPRSRLDDAVGKQCPVLVFGPSSADDDARYLSRHDTHSEWNRRNVTTPSAFSDYLDLGRKTWTLILSADEHREKLRSLFREHGVLFVKSRNKGFSRLFSDYREFCDTLGNPAILTEDTLDVLVSEPMSIRELTRRGRRSRDAAPRHDEWRHHVYQGRLVVSTHAFDLARGEAVDDTTREANVAKALATVDALRTTGFATSYVLDTATLTDGSVAVVEANNFFASGIFSDAAVDAIVTAIAEAPTR